MINDVETRINIPLDEVYDIVVEEILDTHGKVRNDRCRIYSKNIDPKIVKGSMNDVVQTLKLDRNKTYLMR